MSDRLDIEILKRDHPDQIIDEVVRVQKQGRMMLDELFPPDTHEVIRTALVNTGRYVSGHREMRMQLKDTPEGKEIVAMAALARDPGRTQDSLDIIADFAPTAGSSRVQQINQYRKIYETEALISNAVNKIAALIGVGGGFRVRKAKKGKARKAVDQLQAVLDYMTDHINASPEYGVVTSERGLRSVIHTGVRQALVEGDWMGRQQWTQVEVPGEGTFALPITIQTISMTQLEPVHVQLAGLGELWYWSPDSKLRELLTTGDPNNPEVTKLMKKLVDSKLRAALTKDTKVLLEPALLMHVKHRGFATSPFGESLIEPAKLGIRYVRSVTAADLVSMENVINRLTIVKVGSSDPKSNYSKPDVAAARTALMQSFFEEVGPSMLIIWQGDDVDVVDVGAQQSLLDLEERFKIGDHKVKSALGLPDALLFGSTGEGSSAGWASVIGATAQMQELANGFASVLTGMGERVAAENGFDDIELVWEYDKSLLTDNMQTRTQNRADYAMGLVSIRAMIAAQDRDPDAEFLLRCKERELDPNNTTWEEAFMPPQGLQGQAEGGVRGQGPGKVGGEGRTPTEEIADNGATDGPE